VAARAALIAIADSRFSYPLLEVVEDSDI
jgi:hypothetical protein